LLRSKVRLTILGIILNTILFSVKLGGGIYSSSLALLSDSFNSFTDIISSVAIFIAVRLSSKQADRDHPFGHHRAEPLAGLMVAILAAILGFQVIMDSFESFFVPKSIIINRYVVGIVIFTIVVKLFMFIIFRIRGKGANSPALIASSVDYRNDILVSLSVLLGNILVMSGYRIADSIVAMIIGIFIIYSGLKIGMDNIEFLMGKKPPEEVIERIIKLALSVPGVIRLNEVKAHYIGTFIHVEVHIEVDKNLLTEKSHEIAKKVQYAIQSDELVDYAFVHVDPVPA